MITWFRLFRIRGKDKSDCWQYGEVILASVVVLVSYSFFSLVKWFLVEFDEFQLRKRLVEEVEVVFFLGYW